MPEVLDSITPHDVLVVDNDPDDLNLLTDTLSGDRYHVRPVTSGPEAIKAAKRRTPDLILLDLVMPEMDGFEVLDEIRQDPRLADTPVIVVSGKDADEDKVEAFKAGAVDFVTKPYHIPEIKMRVDNHLSLRRMRSELAKQNRQLQSAYRKLEKQEALRDQLTHMLANHLSMPLNAVRVALNLGMRHSSETADEVSAGLMREGVRQSERMAALIEQLLTIRQLEEEEMPLNLTKSDLLETIGQVLEAIPGGRERIAIDCGDQPSAVAEFDAELISKVIDCLLERAVNDSPKNSPIRLRLETENDAVKIVVCDSAPAIPEEHVDRVWRKFWQIEPEKDNDPLRPDSGLSLTWCQFAVEAHGGAVGARPNPGGRGNEFWFSLPHRNPSESSDADADEPLKLPS